MKMNVYPAKTKQTTTKCKPRSWVYKHAPYQTHCDILLTLAQCRCL